MSDLASTIFFTRLQFDHSSWFTFQEQRDFPGGSGNRGGSGLCQQHCHDLPSLLQLDLVTQQLTRTQAR
jgi:hypothetical protein